MQNMQRKMPSYLTTVLSFLTMSHRKKANAESAEERLFKVVKIGDLSALELLIQSEEFSTQQLDKAVYHAAEAGLADFIIPLFKKGANLFNQENSIDGYTCLHVACYKGFPKVVQAILDTNPNDEALDTTGYVAVGFDINHCTAYELAITQQHLECAKLLENTRQACFYHLADAFMRGNADDFKKLLEKNWPYTNIFIEPGYNRGVSFLGVIAIKNQQDSHYETFYRPCFEYLTKQVPGSQISTLIHALIFISDFFREDTASQPCYKALLALLMKLENHYDDVLEISIDGMRFNEDTWKTFKQILLHNKIKSIDFVGEYPIDIDHEVNLEKKYSLEFVSLLLKNSTLIKCNLLIYPIFKPALNLFNLIVERNQLMRKAIFPINEDAIYNNFVNRINEEIYLLNTTYPDMVDKFQELKPIQRVYSLVTTCAFFISNKMSLKESDLSTLNNETRELVVVARMN